MTSPSGNFKPVHTHPFTLEEAMLLEINILVAGKLQNSIKHLQDTQSELRSYLLEDPEDEDGEIGLAITENETTIASQGERIELIKLALTNKVGKDALGHYGLGVNTDSGTGTGDQPIQANVETEPVRDETRTRTGMTTEVETSEEGIHL